MFHTTNNKAEYEALLIGLKVAKALGIENIEVFTNSQLIVRQTQSEYVSKEPKWHFSQSL